MKRIGTLLAKMIGVLVAGAAAAAPTPSGPEFQINTYTTGSQSDPDVCADADGNFVVAWGSYPDVRGRRFDAAGTPLDDDFVVSTIPADRVHIACRFDGAFVVTWGNGDDVFARRYDASGTPQGTAFVVNAYTTGAQGEPAVAVNAAGEFVVVWTDFDGRDGSSYGVFGRRFDGTGTPLGPDFQANSYTTGYQGKPAVDIASAGEFVVAWKDEYRFFPPGFYAVSGQRFNAAGSPAGSEFVVNDETSDLSRGILDVSLVTGGFIVAWPGYDDDLFQKVIFARRFDSGGTPAASVFRVDASDRYPEYARVDADAAGRFVVAWTDAYYGGESAYGVWARAFEADETPDGGPFHVNTETAGMQGNLGPGLAVAANGDFVIVWDSEDQDGDGYGIFGQRFSNPLPPGPCAAAPLDDCLRPVVPLKSKLSITNDTDDRHDRLGWKWVRGEETTQADVGDPAGSDDYAVCLYDASSSVIFEAAVPAGGTCGSKPCWKGLGSPAGAKGYKYKDRDRTPNGVLKVVAKVGLAGKAKVVVKAGGDNLDTAVPGLPLSAIALPARLQLQRSGGTCWEAVYEAEGASVNDGAHFVGRGS